MLSGTVLRTSQHSSRSSTSFYCAALKRCKAKTKKPKWNIIIIIIIIRTGSRAVDRSTLHTSPLSAAVQASCEMTCMSLRILCSQLFCGLPGFHLIFDVMPVSISTDAWRASCTGLLSVRRLACPKSASQHAAMTMCISGGPVSSVTVEFLTKSDHRIPRIRR